MRSGNLFVISGPSGAGKGALVAQLLHKVPDAWVSISMTTRQARLGERDGREYYFVSDQEFSELIETDGLLEWAQVHDARYGTPRASVEKHMAQGDQVILEIDVQGAFQIREKIPHAHLIFIEPPSLTVLRERLIGRGTETEDEIDRRMHTAELELSLKMEYDIQLINDKLDVTTEELVSYINETAERDLRN